MKKNFNKIFKYLSGLFCVLGLFYHSTELLVEYLQGKTIVSIDVYRKTNQTLPAITICYPFLISIEKISKINENYNKFFQDYQAEFNAGTNEALQDDGH